MAWIKQSGHTAAWSKRNLHTATWVTLTTNPTTWDKQLNVYQITPEGWGDDAWGSSMWGSPAWVKQTGHVTVWIKL